MRKIVVGALLLILFLLISYPVQAQEPMAGEIRLWAGTVSIPAGWEIADGHNVQNTLSICAQIGSTYGAAPSGYCKLPDLSGRVPVGYADAQPEFDNVGETGGAKTHTLTINEMPPHTHNFQYRNGSGTLGAPYIPGLVSGYNSTNSYSVDANAISGGGQPHNNLQPYLVLYYIIYTGYGVTPTPTPTATPTETATPTATPNPGGQTGPITGTITGSLVITQALPSYAFTTTLTTGNEFVWSREASYGQIIAGAGGVGVSLVLVFYFVAKFARRPAAND